MMEKRMSNEAIGVLVLTTFIFIIGFLSNIFIITIIIRRKRMQTVTNWFVLNLCICDLIIVLCILPLNQVIPHLGWPFGATACRYIVPSLEQFAGVCVLTHTCLSTARYIGIKNSMRGKVINLTFVRITVIAVWMISFLTMSSTLMGLMGECKMFGPYCNVYFYSFWHQIGYRIMVFTLTYFIPMTATGVSYYKLYRMVRQSMRMLRGHMSNSVQNRRRMQSRRINRTLLTMYIAFGITTLPIQILYFINDIKRFPRTYATRLLMNLCLILFYAQVVTNPLVLFYMGADYRKEGYRLLACRLTFKRSRCRSNNSYLSRVSTWNKTSMKSIRRRSKCTETMDDENNNCVFKSSSINRKKSVAESGKPLNAERSLAIPVIKETQGNTKVDLKYSCASSIIIHHTDIASSEPMRLEEKEKKETKSNEVDNTAEVMLHETTRNLWSDSLNIAAYYDNGTLMYFYDAIFGQVSLNSDDGRETDL